MKNQKNEQLILDFFNAMGPTLADVVDAYKKYFHPQGVWENSGFPKLKGIDQIVNSLTEQNKLFGLERVRVLDHRLLTSADNYVFFERRDSIVNSKDEVVYAFDILGVFEIKDEKIIRWADYMDTSELQKAWEKLDQNSFNQIMGHQSPSS